MKQYSINIQTQGRGTIAIDTNIDQVIKKSGIDTGLCHIFIHHTSASLILTENADSDVRRDLENYFSRIVEDGDPAYFHDAEGPDDMSAHIRSILTQTEISVPVSAGSLAMGTWQGIYLWEHRTSPHRRRLTVTLQGDNTRRNSD
ncbi:MAG: secondary thiamine-phosphate synthase enzyme YjbQ [Gammaproteobacteria bacterium]|nr:secondary thiamine-phosphate synthase enzyme YjbQ [Gammaproteobacteria bacterium]